MLERDKNSLMAHYLNLLRTPRLKLGLWTLNVVSRAQKMRGAPEDQKQPLR